jgi:hypothetical protein
MEAYLAPDLKRTADDRSCLRVVGFYVYTYFKYEKFGKNLDSICRKKPS